MKALYRPNRYTPLIHFFHESVPARINPLLPFDVAQELGTEEVEDENKTLQKQKMKFVKEKKSIKKQLERAREQQPEGRQEGASQRAQKEPEKEINGSRPGRGESESVLKRLTEVRNVGMSSGAIYSQCGDGGSKPPGNGSTYPEEGQKDEDPDPEEQQAVNPKLLLQEAWERFSKFLFKCLETIGITLSSVGVLALSGFLYHKFYNQHVLEKMDRAFRKGDPAYLLAINNKNTRRSDSPSEKSDGEDLLEHWVTRPQQKLLDDIISGKIRGQYFLLMGEKGTGKNTLIMEAIKKVDGNNVAIFDAHADPEIFRIRLGKALDFAYNEDYIGSLFSIRGPRDTTALLDIERAFNKLEEIAGRRRASGENDNPLIIIINHSHLIKENEEGVKLLELLQQKAETLSGSLLVTMIFNSDDYWIYEKLKRIGTRLEVINCRDFNRKETISVLKSIRGKFYPPKEWPDLALSDETCNQIYNLIGGRPQHLSQVSRHGDVIKACHEIIDREKTWFLNQCGLLGEEMDDDVMEYGKFSLSAMLLMREFVEMDRRRMGTLILDVQDAKDQSRDHNLPELPLWRARQVMTRPDYIQQYDNLNIFRVDSDSRVGADSVPMMRAFHEIASQPRFDDLLNDTVERVGDIESLGRTRELVMKDLVHGATYDIDLKSGRVVVGMTKKNTQDDDNGKEMFMEEISRSEGKKRWWTKRMGRLSQSYLPETALLCDDCD